MCIIKSFLDNDFYKFTIQNAIMKLFPSVYCKYKFFNRGNHVFYPGFDILLKNAINKMKFLYLKKEEYDYISCHFKSIFDIYYLNFLKSFRYNPNEVFVSQIKDKLNITIKGLWFRVVLWEIPIMSIISELYYKTVYNQYLISRYNIINILNKKLINYKIMNIKFCEFGTRRRFSYQNQYVILNIIKNLKNNFIGTSNMHLSYLFHIYPFGTHGHEWVMFHGALFGIKKSIYKSLKNWIKIYPNNFNIALTDTYTHDFFLKNFNKKFSLIFNGLRHDSGDPIHFADSSIKHYTNLGIDPKGKILIFSDNININKIKKIQTFCNNKIQIYFGIGSNLTNDTGFKPMNMVIKMIQMSLDNSNWTPVIKISDDIHKRSGDDNLINNELKSIINNKF